MPAVRSVTLPVEEHGDPTGPAVVLLHGFPQTPAAWDRVRPALAAAGYRVLVPTQRGYAAEARPARRRDYSTGGLVADVVALLDRLGIDRAHVVGHDWGAAVAWAMAAGHPDRLLSLTAVSVPHPRALATSMVTSTQALRSWYILLFQLPLLPERLLLARDGQQLRRVLRGTGLGRGPTAAYVEAMRRPGALTAALHWYRGVIFGRGLTGGGPITVPTLYVWGEADRALGPEAAARTAGQVSGPYTFVAVPGASHWIPEEHPEALLTPLLRHLGNPGS
jgi:pimeloyl-ACP methyl ester carboxylesterase